jgi:putative endopeptidase
MILLFAAAALSSCGSQKNTPALNPANFDESYALNEDFYEHFTAGWQKRNPLTPEYSRYGAFDMLRQSNELRVKEIFDGLKESKAEAGSVEQKLADLYLLGLDEERLNKEGVEPLKPALEAIDAITSREQLSAHIGKTHTSSANVFFASGVGPDEKNTSVNVLYFGQSGLGLGDRDYYFAEDGEAIRKGYEQFIATISQLAGYTPEEAERITESVMAIEMELAKAHFTNVERRNPIKNYNKLSLKEFKRKFKNIDWDAYSEAMGFEMPAEVVVSQLPALAAANNLIGKTDLEVIKDYLRFHELRTAANYLSDDFSAAHFEFYGRTLSGSEQQRPRWKRSLAVADGNL